MRPTILALALTLAAPTLAADRQHSERESKFSHQEIDEAIASAEDDSATLSQVVGDALEHSKDPRKHEDAVRATLKDLSDALARLRVDFDQDSSWEDQRAEVRVAYSKWRELDSLLRAHWASRTREELEDLHASLRRLARIYEVDSPART